MEDKAQKCTRIGTKSVDIQWKGLVFIVNIDLLAIEEFFFIGFLLFDVSKS